MKIKKLTRHTALFAVVAVVLSTMWSCQTEEMMEVQTETAPINELKATKLGRKLENPYSVKNMQRALASLSARSNGRISDDVELEATHYYVKFFIQSADEQDLLAADSLELFDFPLDYEIDSLGDYIASEEPITEGKWYWTAVPVGYQIPQVSHEVIEDLFLIHYLLEDTTESGRVAYPFDLRSLEDEALRLTHNEEEPVSTSSNGRKKERPRGNITVWDTDSLAFVGVIGVKVRVNRWFNWESAYTDNTGRYTINEEFDKKIRYSVQFDNRDGFKVWNTLLDIEQAEIHRGGFLNLQKYDPGVWNVELDIDDKEWRWATVNNAAVKYLRYCDQFGIGKPHESLRIAAVSNSDGVGATPMLRRTWGLYGFTTHSQLGNFLLKTSNLSFMANALAVITKFSQPDVIIHAGYAADNETIEVFETTFHELAHASHMKKVGSKYWIDYINYVITYNGYGDGTGKNVGVCALGEAWGYHMGRKLVIDEFGINNTLFPNASFERFDPINLPSENSIVDYLNNSGWTGWIPAGIMNDLVDANADQVRNGFNDNAFGYSHRQLFDAMDSDVKSPQQFRDRLLQENADLDRADVLNLFEAYFWN